MIWAIVKSVITTPLGIYDLGLDPMSEVISICFLISLVVKNKIVCMHKQHQLECTWMHESQIDWIYQGPVSACLVINSVFLLRIMWVSSTFSIYRNKNICRNAQKTEKVSFIKKCVFKVLIIKLRSNNNVETRQYRKATKALLVLIPLLGITYLVVMAGPAEGLGKYIFAIIRALLISTQVWVQKLRKKYTTLFVECT